MALSRGAFMVWLVKEELMNGGECSNMGVVGVTWRQPRRWNWCGCEVVKFIFFIFFFNAGAVWRSRRCGGGGGCLKSGVIESGNMLEVSGDGGGVCGALIDSGEEAEAEGTEGE